MGRNTSETDRENFEFVDRDDRNLQTDNSGALAFLSSGKRAERRTQKLRDELVRDHIESEKRAPSFLQSLTSKIVKLA